MAVVGGVGGVVVRGRGWVVVWRGVVWEVMIVEFLEKGGAS